MKSWEHNSIIFCLYRGVWKGRSEAVSAEEKDGEENAQCLEAWQSEE